MTDRKKVTLPTLFKKVADGELITWLTCYDYPTAHLQEQAGIDMILVGDSLGMTMLGYESTLPVTMARDEKGDCGAGALVGRDHAPHLKCAE
jgi:ketopantoate hydroxymethyltransferase